MEEAEATPATVDPHRATEFPPLRVHHFLLWTVVAAVWMTIIQYEIRNFDSFPTNNRVQITSLRIASRIVETAVITICIVGFINRYRGGGFPSQPGHWIALFMATTVVPTTLVYAIIAWFGLESRLWPDISSYLYALLSVIWSVIFFVLAKHGGETSGWRIVYLLFGLISISTVVIVVSLMFIAFQPHMNVLAVIQFILLSCLALAALFAMATDRLFAVPRDWAHWLSVLLPFAICIVAAGWAIVSRLVAKF